MPAQVDVSIGDDIERIRLLRNDEYGHVADTADAGRNSCKILDRDDGCVCHGWMPCTARTSWRHFRLFSLRRWTARQRGNTTRKLLTKIQKYKLVNVSVDKGYWIGVCHG